MICIFFLYRLLAPAESLFMSVLSSGLLIPNSGDAKDNCDVGVLCGIMEFVPPPLTGVDVTGFSVFWSGVFISTDCFASLTGENKQSFLGGEMSVSSGFTDLPVSRASIIHWDWENCLISWIFSGGIGFKYYVVNQALHLRTSSLGKESRCFYTSTNTITPTLSLEVYRSSVMSCEKNCVVFPRDSNPLV